ncbi:uncharacterized protein LOC131237147 [Magnolia sinica]|uniref:uncharacterized protein LOC131237147 n=1 Tax=Magnolia sinica TaxID=86752 RepID=UPI00265B67C0|nr:uncharacterized protein LOC131237147 [Magnolia sinica]
MQPKRSQHKFINWVLIFNRFAGNLLKGQTVGVIGAETPTSKTNENRWIRMKCSHKVLPNAPKTMATSKEQHSRPFDPRDRDSMVKAAIEDWKRKTQSSSGGSPSNNYKRRTGEIISIAVGCASGLLILTSIFYLWWMKDALGHMQVHTDSPRFIFSALLLL